MGNRQDLVGVRKDGTKVPVKIGLTYLKGAKESFAVSFIQDISEKKKNEQLLLERKISNNEKCG